MKYGKCKICGDELLMKHKDQICYPCFIKELKIMESNDKSNKVLNEIGETIYESWNNDFLENMTPEKPDWREAAKELAGNIVNHPNLYGMYTIYEEIEKIARIVDPTIPAPVIITPRDGKTENVS